MRKNPFCCEGKIKYRIAALSIWLTLWVLLLLPGCTIVQKHNIPEDIKTSSGTSENKKPEQTPEQTPDVQKVEDKKDTPVSNDKNQDAPEIEGLKLSNGSYESINNILKGRKDISDIKWSGGKDQAAFALYKDLAYSDDAVMYIWKVGKTEPSVIDTPRGRFCDFLWSPDDKYILADTGTSVCRIGYIISARNRKRVGEIAFVFSSLWSPDSKWIAIGRQNKTKTIVDTELEGSVDTAIYNIERKREKVVAKGAADFYCTPEKWESNGDLTYIKKYLSNRSEEKFTYSMRDNLSIPVMASDTMQ